MPNKIKPYLLLVPQALLTLLFLTGIVSGITQSLGVIPSLGLTKPTMAYYKEILEKPELLHSVLYSLRIAIISSSAATIIGVFFCALIVMGGKMKGAVTRAVQLPIIVPHVVAALFAINIFSQNGILSRVAYALGLIGDQQQFPAILYNAQGSGVILAYLWKEIPFIIYFVIALMSNINNSLGEAAVNLGARPRQVFFKVTLPLCRRTIWSGFLIIFVFSLGAYELPLLLGATAPKALPVLAYIQYIHPDLSRRPSAMALNGVIMIISLISAGIYFILIERRTCSLNKGGGS